MKKIINPVMKETYNGRKYRVFVEITYKDGNLSLHGVEGALPSGNCLGGCGQIGDYLNEEVSRYIEGWTPKMVEELQEIWKRWHLNGMRAGTPKQQEFIREWKETHRYDYTEACKALEEVGLLYDDDYKYGSGWLKEEVPEDVIDWLFSLPDATTNPAWI